MDTIDFLRRNDFGRGPVHGDRIVSNCQRIAKTTKSSESTANSFIRRISIMIIIFRSLHLESLRTNTGLLICKLQFGRMLSVVVDRMRYAFDVFIVIGYGRSHLLLSLAQKLETSETSKI